MAGDARISTGLPGHPKTKKLIKRMGPSAGWHLVRLFLWVADNRSNGDLAGMTDEDIELSIDWTGTTGDFIRELVAVGFMDGDEGAREIHDWMEHNPWAAGAEKRSAKARWNAVKRYHGAAEADLAVPEYAAIRNATSNAALDAASSAGSNASSTSPEEPSTAPSPSPLPSPSPSPSLKEEANASLSPASPTTAGNEVLEGMEPEKKPGRATPACPIDDLLDLYEAKLPALPQVRKSLFKNGANAKAMKKRWEWVMTASHERGERAGQRLATTVPAGVEWFGKYFDHVADSEFLTGRDGKWVGCNIGWLMTVSNFEKVLSGQYHKAEVEHA